MGWARAMESQMAAGMHRRIDLLLRADMTAELAKRKVDADAALCSSNPRRAFGIIRDIKPKPVPKYWRVMRSDGDTSSDYVEERQGFRDHFGQLLHGSFTTFADLVKKERSHASRCPGDEVSRSILALPTFSDVVRGNAAAPSFKAVAENKVAGDVLKAAPWAAAAVWHPLAVKTAMSLRPPLQWVGGMAVELLKANGVQTSYDAYRD
eukprot:9936947-Karenia_brevis.AAC.1